MTTNDSAPLNFIQQIIEDDRRTGKYGGRVHTRFPAGAERLPAHRPRQVDLPELRPAPRVRRQVQPALRRHQPDQGRAGVRRLDQGRRPLARLRLGRPLFYASDYFEQLYDWAVELIKKGKAYVCDLTAERDPRAPRHADRAGQEQPVSATAASRRTSTCSSRMQKGEFPDGARTLRAKIDMASPNLNLRDPVMYRILHAHAPPHRRQVVHLPDVRLRARPVATRSRGITHSICTLEFENHRPLYDWFMQRAGHLCTRSRSSSPGST